jgi:hypothetical protein
MKQTQKPSKWRHGVFVAVATISLVLCTMLNTILPTQNADAIDKDHSFFNTPSMSVSASASANVVAGKHKGENKHKISVLEKHKDRAVEWLYKKTYVVPRSMLIDYVDFITVNVDPDLQPLVVALLTVESDGNPFAVSHKGACGITQIVPKYWENRLIEEGIISEKRDLFDFRLNILSHQYILKTLMADEAPNNHKSLLIRYSGYHSGYAEKVMKRMSDLTRFLTTS